MTFPEIQFLSDVLPFFEGRSDFSVQAHDDYIAIHYAYADGDTFALPLLRGPAIAICRGADPTDAIKTLIAKYCHGIADVAAIKPLIGNPTCQNLRPAGSEGQPT